MKTKEQIIKKLLKYNTFAVSFQMYNIKIYLCAYVVGRKWGKCEMVFLNHLYFLAIISIKQRYWLFRDYLLVFSLHVVIGNQVSLKWLYKLMFQQVPIKCHVIYICDIFPIKSKFIKQGLILSTSFSMYLKLKKSCVCVS